MADFMHNFNKRELRNVHLQVSLVHMPTSLILLSALTLAHAEGLRALAFVTVGVITQTFTEWLSDASTTVHFFEKAHFLATLFTKDKSVSLSTSLIHLCCERMTGVWSPGIGHSCSWLASK